MHSIPRHECFTQGNFVGLVPAGHTYTLALGQDVTQVQATAGNKPLKRDRAGHANPSRSAQGGLMVEFGNSGGHAVVVMKAGKLPTLLNADFTFRSEELVKGDQVSSQQQRCTAWHYAVIVTTSLVDCQRQPRMPQRLAQVMQSYLDEAMSRSRKVRTNIRTFRQYNGSMTAAGSLTHQM